MKKLQRDISTFLKERKWDRLRPGDIAKGIVIESTELLEIFQWENPSLDEVKNDKEGLDKIKEELADIFIYALDMSVLLGFDSERIIRNKLKKVCEKYPPATANQRGDVEAGSKADINYWRIKNRHRKQVST